MTDEAEAIRDGAYDDFLDALDDGDGYFVDTGRGSPSLPPQPNDGSHGSEDATEPLPSTGEIRTYTVIHAPLPAFAERAPYVVALADFGPVTITGQVRDVEPDAVEVGTTVEATVETTDENRRFVRFLPQPED